MSAPANTKVERVIEAVENMALMIAQRAVNQGPTNRSNLESFTEIADAREEARTALMEFLKPTLRVVGE